MILLLDTNLIPRHENNLRRSLERCPSKVQGHSASAVDEEVKPAVLPGQREALEGSGGGHPDSDQP